MKHMNFMVTDETARLIKLLSIIEKKTITEIMRELIEEKIKKSDVEKKAKMLM